MMKSRRPRHKTSGDLSNKMRVRNAGVAQFNINYRKIGYMYKMMYSFWVEAEHVSLDLFCFFNNKKWIPTLETLHTQKNGDISELGRTHNL